MLMPGPFSGKNLISILVTDYIQKRRGQALLFSFKYNMLPNLISNFNHYMDRALKYILVSKSAVRIKWLAIR